MGYYRLVDSDGLIRTANYQADPINGFTAHIVRSSATGAAIGQQGTAIAPPAIPFGRAEPFAPQPIFQWQNYPINTNVGV